MKNWYFTEFYPFYSLNFVTFLKSDFEVAQIRGVFKEAGTWPFFGRFLWKSWPFSKFENGNPDS